MAKFRQLSDPLLNGLKYYNTLRGWGQEVGDFMAKRKMSENSLKLC